MSQIRCVVDAKALLGEGPLWDEPSQRLYWVDIKGRQVHSFDPMTGHGQRWSVPQDVGSLAVRESGGLVLALQSGFFRLNTDSGAVSTICEPEPERPGNRFNDGKPDRQGRFWAGSMDDAEVNPSGFLYRLDLDGRATRMVENIAIANCLCWSPDSRTLYFGDSLVQTVWAWDFNPEAGTLSNRREFITLDDGYPDGATVDADGFIWLAVWNGWRIDRYAPDGRLDRRIELPVQCPTCPAFGGPELATLYVTSASNKISEPERQPQAGGVFAIDDIGVKGIAEARYKG